MSEDWHGWDRDTWRSWSPDVLEREVSPSSMVPNRDISAYLTEYRTRGERVLANNSLRARTISYGKNPNEIFTFVPAHGNPERAAPAVVFIHGGYWQALSHVDGLYPAESLAAEGCHYMSVNYTLAPAASLPHIVEQVKSTLQFIREMNIATHVVLAGHSAGAQLASLGHSCWPDAALLLFGGVFDLEPLVTTPINNALGLDLATAREMSPVRHAVTPTTSLFVTGESETNLFKQQSASYAMQRREAGDSVHELEVAGANHFDVVFTLADPNSSVRHWIRSAFEQQ